MNEDWNCLGTESKDPYSQICIEAVEDDKIFKNFKMTYHINVIDHEGSPHKIEATVGFSIMEIIRDAGLDIEAICGGCCACATCHCYVDENWLEKISKADDDEESMLDQAMDIKKNSRLSCQIPFTEELNGITLTLAPKF